MTYPRLGMDIETTGLDPYTDTIISAQIANSEDNTVDIIDVRKDNFQDFFNTLRLYKGKVVIQNAKFDLKFLRKFFGLLYFDLFDTYVAEKLISADRRKEGFDLSTLSENYLGIEMDKSVRNEFLLPMFQMMDLSEGQLNYGALDAWVLPRIMDEQLKCLAADGLERVAALEFRTVPATAKAELSGIKLDVEAWTTIYNEEIAKARKLRQQIADLTGRPSFNPNSHVQVKEVMNDFGIPIPKVHGKETTKAEFIERIDHDFIRLLLKYRKSDKLASTYGEDFLNNINPVTGRIHADFNQCGTGTGRYSSEKPNLQNIPKRDGNERFRECFIAAAGHMMISADFSGQEMMVMAQESGDPTLINIYREGKDCHTATANMLFGVPYEEVTKDQRFYGKTFNFGVSYGSSAWNMANKLNKSIGEIEKYLAQYWKVYPVLQKWQRRSGLLAWTKGYSTTFWDRRRYFDRDFLRKDEVMRRGSNMRIQGTSADMTKRAICLIDEWFEETRTPATFVNFVHDETEVEAQEAYAEETLYNVRRLMEQAGREFVSVVTQKADAQLGKHWM